MPVGSQFVPTFTTIIQIDFTPIIIPLPLVLDAFILVQSRFRLIWVARSAVSVCTNAFFGTLNLAWSSYNSFYILDISRSYFSEQCYSSRTIQGRYKSDYFIRSGSIFVCCRISTTRFNDEVAKFLWVQFIQSFQASGPAPEMQISAKGFRGFLQSLVALPCRNNAIKTPRVQWIVGPQSTATYNGVDNFALIDCFIFGNLGAPGFRQQLGVALQGFGGTLTVTGNEFSQVGWGILELGNGGSFSSNGAYSDVLFDSNYIHDCYGGVNFRCNSTFPCATVTITNNVWRDISNTITDEAWPLKGFEAFNVKSLTVSNNVFDNIDRGAIGHGGAAKGMAFEAFGIETIGITNNTIRNTAQGFSIRSGPTFGTFPCPSGAINDNFFEQVAFTMLNVSCNSVQGGGSINVGRNAWDPDRGSGPQAGDIVFASAAIQASVEATLFPWRATLDRAALNDGLARNCSSDCGSGRCDFLLTTCYCTNGGTPPSCLASQTAPSSQNTLDPNGQSLSANPAFAIAMIVVLAVVIVGAIAFTIFQVRRYRNRTALAQRGQTYGSGK